jgi:hypothetical protein
MKLSCVLVLSGPYPAGAKTVAHLSRQTVASDLELVLVGPAEFEASLPEVEFSGFAAWQYVELPSLPYAATGFAAGTKAARAPLTVLCEDHCYPEPAWAEALLAASAGSEASAIGPAMDNANPRSLTSWANFLLCFPEWFRPGRSGEISHSAGHNTCYRVEDLKPYWEDLERWFNPERVLHLELQERGKKIQVCAEARVSHVNISLRGAYLAQSFLGGRVFGASRSQRWPAAKNLLYALASPLVPPLRLWRLHCLLGTVEKRRAARFWPALPQILMGLLAHATGEALGYLFGEGGSALAYARYELYRRNYVLEEEKPLLRAS